MTSTTDSSSHNLEELSKQQIIPSLLPKESEYVERKRPLAIQELLEKKRARLAHQEPIKRDAVANAELDSSDAIQLILFNKINDQNKDNENSTDQLLEDTSMFYLGKTRDDDNETASCSSSGGVGCSFSWNLFEQTPPFNNQQMRKWSTYSNTKNTGNYERISTPLSSYNTTLVNSPNKNCDFSQTLGMEIGENPLAKSVPCDRIFAQVPGRLSLLSNVVKYKMTVGEVKRRLMGPESFNFSLLGALLRRAKMPEKSQMLIEELNQVGLSIPRGRRRLSQVTLLSALTEAESLQLANDFKKITESEFPAKLMALESLSLLNNETTIIPRYSILNNDVKNNNSIRLQKLSAAIRLTNQFLQLLGNDRSPTMEKNEEPILCDELQTPLLTFSMLTHGFGNPAIQVGVTCFLRFLEHQVKIITEQEQIISAYK